MRRRCPTGWSFCARRRRTALVTRLVSMGQKKALRGYLWVGSQSPPLDLSAKYCLHLWGESPQFTMQRHFLRICQYYLGLEVRTPLEFCIPGHQGELPQGQGCLSYPQKPTKSPKKARSSCMSPKTVRSLCLHEEYGVRLATLRAAGLWQEGARRGWHRSMLWQT